MGPSKLTNFLSQPYPFYYRGKTLFVISSCIFAVTFLFNYLFQPFQVNLSEHRMGYAWICFIHALIPSLLFLLIFLVVQQIKEIDEKWKVKEEIWVILSYLILVGIFNFLVRDLIYTNPDNWSAYHFWVELKNTILAGILFILIFIPFNFKRLHDRYQEKSAKLISLQIPIKTTEIEQVIPIKTQLKADDFELEINQFLFAKAEKNYLEIYLARENEIQKLVKRITLTELENQLKAISFVAKIHRSYLINLKRIESISGNAQGYQLKLKKIKNPIPVSRSKISTFEEKMKVLNRHA
ncbi:LytTR family DNA-binding domain-containing protein [Aequorivita todarodis]|uniref:LytR/AlgR family response regulator transcription factor n=1 Tax=Aequorivita todarodis TaxID=2036821 RepID=UPI0023504BDD|nr:LytTR family DNA-binding domain-containing protein [Aequorivita todarodis]MDC8001213.1 LytTR family DNA-binding domain-containing protein [Aequorivita todarodis]